MVAIFTTTLLISSSLLFLLQPMFARMALPLLGGSPAVWNTCMVFFQTSLLAGYLYAHVLSRWLKPRRQIIFHAALLLLPLLVLPIAISEQWTPPVDRSPIPWLLLLLTATIGLPFFFVASTAPLMQQWFSQLNHKQSDDPYFLYAASNAGSMTALLAYPLVLEPLLDLPQQSALWTAGYVLLVLAIHFCAAIALRHHHKRAVLFANSESLPTIRNHVAPLTLMTRMRWIALAAAPSSLLLGVTQYITTDLVVVPALWVIPLALYLLTFIIVFARRRIVPQPLGRRLVPPAAVILLLMLLIEATQPLLLVVLGHLGAFFILALACHGELADARPHAQHLTAYYLMMGVGGMLGGMFNALLAPHLFSTVAEYPIAIVAAALLMTRIPIAQASTNPDQENAQLRSPTAAPIDQGSPSHAHRWRPSPLNLALPIALGLITVSLILLADVLSLPVSPMRLLLTAGLPALGCYLLSKHPLRFGLALAAVFLAATLDTINRGHVLEAHRGFFGVHRITRADSFHRLFHGTTLHGAQSIDPETRKPTQPHQPLAYYHRDSPIGELFTNWRQENFQSIGVVGLGVGALAAYGNNGQSFTFFEIDPLVQRIAEDQRYFTFISEARSRGVDTNIILGDARLTLKQEAAGRFDLLVIDAFSSDAIPVHLLTRQAMELYWDALAPDGIIAMHISNRYLNLAPVVANLAASTNAICLLRDDTYITPDETQATGREGSLWALLARKPEHVEPFLTGTYASRWFLLKGDHTQAVWTDQYANVLGALRW